MGAESMAIGSIITTFGGLCGVVLSKCKCIYKRDDEGNCSPIFSFTDKPIQADNDEIKINHENLGGEIPVIIISKK